MKTFWVEFRHEGKMLGGYFEAKSQLAIRLFWKLGEITYIGLSSGEAAA